MPRSLKGSCCLDQGMDLDGGWVVVADAGAFVGFLDAVAVVAGAFDRSGATAVASLGQGSAVDLGQDAGQVLQQQIMKLSGLGGVQSG